MVWTGPSSPKVRSGRCASARSRIPRMSRARTPSSKRLMSTSDRVAADSSSSGSEHSALTERSRPIRARPRRERPPADWKELKDLYPAVRRTLDDALLTDWHELGEAVGYLFDRPMLPEAILPLACCSAVGGNAIDAVPLAAAIVAGAASMRILDDIADRDRPGQLWQRVGVDRAATYAAALEALMFELVHQAPLKTHVTRRLGRALSRAYL